MRMTKSGWMKGIELNELCKQIIQSDNSIRFVGIADTSGKRVAVNYRRGLVPYLDQTKIERYTL